MLIVKVEKGESIDRALKRMKRKQKNTKLIKKLRDRQEFVKPSTKKRKQIQKAKYAQKLKESEQNY